MMPRRTLWPAFLLPLVLTGGVRRTAATPVRPLLLLFPHVAGDADDGRALVALRAKLRHDGQLDVLTFDPDSPSLQRAAADAKHPEWLTGPVTADSERLDIARAVGAAYAATVGHANKNKTDVHLMETASAARVWDYVSYPTDTAAASIEQSARIPAPASPAPDGGAAGPETVPSSPAVVPPVATPASPPPTTPSPVVTVPASPPPPITPAPASPAPPVLGAAGASPAEGADLTDVQPLIRQGDQAVARGDMVDAYTLYRQAINDAPLSDVPRLKLAQAYLQGGLPDKALDEAQRALTIAPGSVALQEFLIKFDAESGTSQGRVARYKALVAKNPDDPAAHLDLADAFWGSTDYASAETEYKSARDLAPAGSDARRAAIAHLARLYAATGRYDDCLAAMKASGDAAYPLVLGVLQNAADTLVAAMDVAHDDFDAGKMTRADFYAKMKDASDKSQALADLVAKITPPERFSHSHLDRVQGLSLLAQAAAITVDYIESNDVGRRDKAAQLEKDAQTEMLTAHAAEQKLGLWAEDKGGGDETDKKTAEGAG